MDLYHDGKLSYTAFKEAVGRNYIFLNSLWLDPKQINLTNISNSYFSNDKYLNDFADFNYGQPLSLKRYDFGKLF